MTLNESAFNTWRFAHFGTEANTPGIGGPTDDPDGDGQDNQSEYVAGTLPDSAQSVFALCPSRIAGAVHLSFPAQVGISYTVQYKDSLADPTWHKLVDIPPATLAHQEDVTDPGSPAQRYYRVATPQQP